MSDVKISALTAVTTPSATDVIPIVSSSTTKKLALNNINTVGTITTGVWNGTAIGLAYGGTGAALTAASGGIVYSTASALAIAAAADFNWDNTNKRLGIGMTPSQVLDITKNTNAGVAVQILNNSSGTGAYTQFGLSNGTTGFVMTHDGASYTPVSFHPADGAVMETNGTGGMTLASTNGSTGNIIFVTGGTSEKARLTTAGNFKIGGTAARGTTEGTNQVVIFNGTAPAGTLTNGASFFCATGEMKVIDSAGNITQLSPHEKETNFWVYNSVHTPTGKVLKIDMEKMMKAINDKFGWDFVHEYIDK